MVAIGVFSDSEGDVQALDAALRFLAARGARRFLFAGGRFEDLDAWARWKRQEVRARADYSDADFLEDVRRYLVGLEQVERPPAFGVVHEQIREMEDLARMKDKVLRAPERGSLAYQDPSVPRKVVELLGDTLCCLVHDKNDLEKEDLINAVVLVHGKGPEPKVVQIGPRTFVTPGRLAGGPQGTVGILEVSERQAWFSAFTLEGTVVIDKQAIQLGAGKTRVSVK